MTVTILLQFQFSPAIETTDLTWLLWYYKDNSTVNGDRYDLLTFWGNSPDESFMVFIMDNDNNIRTGHKWAGDTSWTFAGYSGNKTQVPVDRWTHIGVVLKGGGKSVYFINSITSI